MRFITEWDPRTFTRDDRTGRLCTSEGRRVLTAEARGAILDAKAECRDLVAFELSSEEETEYEACQEEGLPCFVRDDAEGGHRYVLVKTLPLGSVLTIERAR